LHEDQSEGTGLVICKSLCELLGGKLIIKTEQRVSTQVTFDVQCTTYSVKKFDPREGENDHEVGLKLPLRKLRRLSDAVAQF